MEELTVKEALEAIKAIKQSIGNVDKQKLSKSPKIIETNILLHACVGLSGAILLAQELFTGIHTASFLYSRNNLVYQICGLGALGIGLFCLVAIASFTLRQKSKRLSKDEAEFIKMNFVSLANISFLADLLIKYLVVSAIIIANRPEWIGSLLLIFTADYLIQGRFFVLPSAYALAIGAILLVAGLLQAYFSITSIVPALCVFTILSVASVISLKKNSTSS